MNRTKNISESVRIIAHANESRDEALLLDLFGMDDYGGSSPNEDDQNATFSVRSSEIIPVANKAGEHSRNEAINRQTLVSGLNEEALEILLKTLTKPK